MDNVILAASSDLLEIITVLPVKAVFMTVIRAIHKIHA